jgi:hypothetical protein
LQKLLGHRYLSTTQIYARVYDATVERDYRRAMERLEQNQGIPVPPDGSSAPKSLSEPAPIAMPTTESVPR